VKYLIKDTPLYKGKAKSVYRSEIDGEFIVKFRDDITAFDGGKKDILKGKGRYNALVSSHIFRLLEEKGIRTHFIRMIDETTMVVMELSMIPLEVIVRNVAAGSMTRKYPINEGTKLSQPVIVIDYKDDSRHDPMLNDDLILALDLLNKEELEELKEISLRINNIMYDYMHDRDITLVDFKIEFGKQNGNIILGDEISMDSMRLWDSKTGDSMDKDVYRFDKGDVMKSYESVAARILDNKVKGEP